MYYKHHNALAAVPLMDEMMTLLATTAHRHMEVRCFCSDTVGEDEATLLFALRALQHGDLTSAQRILRPLLGGNLSRSFCRVGSEYTQSLKAAGLELSGVAYLQAVTNLENTQA